MRIIVQTQAHIFRNDWELELDGLEPLTVGLPFLINLDFGKQRFHKLPLFLIVHDGIELIKVNQHLVDVVARQLFRLNRHLLGSGSNELVFRILDFIIHLVKPVIKVCLAFHVVLIIRVEGINLLHQSCLYGITLPKLLFMGCDLLLNGRGIHLHADLFLHHGGELRIAYQLDDDLCHGTVQQFFVDLLFIVAFMSMGHRAVLSAVVIKILVFCAVCLVLDSLVTVHSHAANRAFHNTGQQMYFCILASVDVFVLLRLRQQLDLRLMP